MASRQSGSRRTTRRRTSSPAEGVAREGARHEGVSRLLRDGMLTLREQAAQRGSVVSEFFREQARGYVRQRKSRAADELANLGDAIRVAANKLHDREIRRLADLAGTAAERVDDAARYVKQHDLEDLLNEVSKFARRRPGLLVAGLFLAGLTAGRFVKAGAAELNSTSRRRR